MLLLFSIFRASETCTTITDLIILLIHLFKFFVPQKEPPLKPEDYALILSQLLSVRQQKLSILSEPKKYMPEKVHFYKNIINLYTQIYLEEL